MLYDLNEAIIRFSIHFLKIINCLILHETCYLLVENESPSGHSIQVILKICLKEKAILKTLFINNNLQEIFLRKENEYYFVKT